MDYTSFRYGSAMPDAHRIAAKARGRELFDPLAATTSAARMVMRGSEMREWLVLRQADAASWPDAIAESYAYVDRITP